MLTRSVNFVAPLVRHVSVQHRYFSNQSNDVKLEEAYDDVSMHKPTGQLGSATISHPFKRGTVTADDLKNTYEPLMYAPYIRSSLDAFNKTSNFFSYMIEVMKSRKPDRESARPLSPNEIVAPTNFTATEGPPEGLKPGASAEQLRAIARDSLNFSDYVKRLKDDPNSPVAVTDKPFNPKLFYYIVAAYQLEAETAGDGGSTRPVWVSRDYTKFPGFPIPDYHGYHSTFDPTSDTKRNVLFWVLILGVSFYLVASLEYSQKKKGYPSLFP